MATKKKTTSKKTTEKKRKPAHWYDKLVLPETIEVPTDLLARLKKNSAAQEAMQLARGAEMVLELRLRIAIVRSSLANSPGSPQQSRILMELFEPENNGALSTFAAKTKLAYAMGLISTKQFKDLTYMRKIRNEFAHTSGPMKFTESPVREYCRQLSTARKARPANSAQLKSCLRRAYNAVAGTVSIESWEAMDAIVKEYGTVDQSTPPRARARTAKSSR